MVLWIASFVGVTFLAVPELYKLAGISIRDLDSTGKAEFTLACQVAETLATMLIFRLVTLKYDDELEEKQLFR